MTRHGSIVVVSLTAAVLFAGCNEKTSETAASITVDAPKEVAAVQPATVSQEKKTLDPAQTGSFKGVVVYEGTVPAPAELSVKGNPECAALHEGGKILSEELLVKDGKLRNAFVYIKEGLEGYEFEVPTEPAVITNNKCVYAPHVLGVRVGQPVNFLNEDSTLHNVHAYPKLNKPFNLGLPFVNMKQTKTFTQEEVMIPMKCDVHPWMLGYLAVLKHPFFAVTGDDGSFEIKGIPAGEYTAEVWHEKLGAQELKVKIETAAPAETTVTYKAA